MNIKERIEILASFGNDLAQICNGNEIEGFPGFELIHEILALIDDLAGLVETGRAVY